MLEETKRSCDKERKNEYEFGRRIKAANLTTGWQNFILSVAIIFLLPYGLVSNLNCVSFLICYVAVAVSSQSSTKRRGTRQKRRKEKIRKLHHDIFLSSCTLLLLVCVYPRAIYFSSSPPSLSIHRLPFCVLIFPKQTTNYLVPRLFVSLLHSIPVSFMTCQPATRL